MVLRRDPQLIREQERTMESVNTMRAILVAGAVVAAIVAAALGVWTAALIMAVGVAGHFALWAYVHRHGTHPTIRHTDAAKSSDA